MLLSIGRLVVSRSSNFQPVSAAQTRFQPSPSPPAGLIGTAPSAGLLAIWNEREGALVDAGESAITLGSCLHTRPLGALGTQAAGNRKEDGSSALTFKCWIVQMVCNTNLYG